MNSSLLLLLAALFTVSGPLAAWATPCTRPMDCQLNGDCVSGKCECDKGWAGDDCGQLNLDGGKVAYGHGSPLTPNTSSWGGGPPQWDEQQQQYHLFVSEIQFGCGMGAWAYFSAAAHAVSPNIDGPYTRVDLAVPVWTHNTLYAYSPQDKMHLIFSIGEGDSNSSCNPPIQCAGGITPGASHLRPPSPWPANVTCPIRHTTTVHSSRSLDGPWESASLRFSGSPAHDPDPLNASFGTSNPAPLILPNGTVLLVTRGKDAFRPGGPGDLGLLSQAYHNLWMWRADSWNSTYELLALDGVDGSLHIGDGKTSTEDPVMYRGRRGYHLIIHSSPRLSHAWSEDAFHWEWSSVLTGPEPSAAGNDHERPRVTLDANGDLDFLFLSHMTTEAASSGEDEAALLVYKAL